MLKLPGPCFLMLSFFIAPAGAIAQAGALRGAVLDPSNAAVPGASITLTRARQSLHSQSGPDGRYLFTDLAPASYSLSVTAPGFAPLTVPAVLISAAHTRDLDLHLAIPVQKQELTVQGQNPSVGLNPDQNAGATVISGSALNALSDNPDELQAELEALAGPAAGPNGGQIYIDGFQGGQLPPKSAILEIHVNQNPFSAEFERIGYGRVDIVTRPGSQTFSGSIGGFGTDSVLNTANPLVTQQPSYYYFGANGNLSGPLSKHASGFFNFYRMTRQNQSIVDAVNPLNTAALIDETYPNPSTLLALAPRVDLQLGSSNTVTIRDAFYRSTVDGSGVGALNLPSQANNSTVESNSLQVSDTLMVSRQFVNETRIQWLRVRNQDTPASVAPTVIVEGAFTSGGFNAGAVQDHNDNVELQNFSTAIAGPHTFRFGTQLDTYRDANYSTSGQNGAYTFSSLAAYLAGQPSQYSATVIRNPLARALVFDGALFFQDDWRLSPDFELGLGLRFEGQNRIRNHSHWAPRIALAWTPGRRGSAPAKTVIRAGYGWFYTPFTAPVSFGFAGGTPYIIQTIHNNGVNQQNIIANNPGSFNPDGPPPTLASNASAVPYIHTIDPHFHVALDMQTGIGVDRQLSQSFMANVTYLYTQGVHQYLTDNVNAPSFDPASYTVSGAAPAAYNYQFQSGGFYREQQLILTLNAHLKSLSVDANYTLSQAKSDTQGVTSFPSDSQDPGLDYGRAVFGIRSRFMLADSYSAPHGIVIASLLEAQSGTPYNLTTGADLTANNQFNARPAYGVCGASGVVSTPYGCLDTDPAGKGERIVPFDLGTGPANAVFHLRVSKVFGIGPRIAKAGAGQTYNGENSVSGRGLSGGGASIRLDAAAPRRYNLTFVAGASNLFNMVNLAPPNGVLTSPLFGKSQALASGSYNNPTPGNRAIIFQANFSF